MTDYGKCYHQADELRKGNQYIEAESAFHDLWDSYPTANVGWRWSLCLRKLGRVAEALAVIVKVRETFPDDDWVRKEHAWCLYYQEVKPAQEAVDLGRVVHFAQQMIDLSQDPLIVCRAVFAVEKVAKERGKWDVVHDWCNKLDPQQLSAEPKIIAGRRSMSERELWYFAEIKALIQLQRWTQARALALEATTSFPRKTDFRRWAAEARGELGDLEGAIEELEALTRFDNAPWYILGQLARFKFRLGQPEQALRIACRSALAVGEDKAKVKLYELLAEIGLALDQSRFAALNLALAKAVREREGWPVKQDLTELERRANVRLSSTDSLDIPLTIPPLTRRCQQEWRERSTTVDVRHTGRICKLIEGRNFGFIKPDTEGGDIFVLLRDLPQNAQIAGAVVEYTLEDSFDQAKNRKSVRAINVRLASKHPLLQVVG